jgi:hypothetical protein
VDSEDSCGVDDAFNRRVAGLQFLAESREEVATTREVPQIPADAYVGG